MKLSNRKTCQNHHHLVEKNEGLPLEFASGMCLKRMKLNQDPVCKVLRNALTLGDNQSVRLSVPVGSSWL